MSRARGDIGLEFFLGLSSLSLGLWLSLAHESLIHLPAHRFAHLDGVQGVLFGVLGATRLLCLLFDWRKGRVWISYVAVFVWATAAVLLFLSPPLRYEAFSAVIATLANGYMALFTPGGRPRLLPDEGRKPDE